MLKILYALLIFTLISCQPVSKEKRIRFFIVNKSEAPIKNVRLTTSEHLSEHLYEAKFQILGPEEKVSGFLIMQENRSDGCYLLAFTREGEKQVIKCFGYYTNGAPLEKWVKFQIKNDTVIEKFGGLPL